MKRIKSTSIYLLMLVAALFSSCTIKEVKYISPESLKDATIGVAMGSVHDTYVTENCPNATIQRTEAMVELPLLLAAGRVDYILLDHNVSTAMLSQKQNRGLEVVDPNIFVSDIAAGFSFSNKKLCGEFNQFIAQFMKSDRYADIVKRWHVDGDGGEIPHIESHSSGEKIRVGLSSLIPPFCIVKDNELQGSSVEIAKEFALEYGYVVELCDMNITGLLSSIQTDRVDLLIPGLIYTEERAKSILFSDIYIQSPSVVIARKEGFQASGETPKQFKSYVHPTITSSTPGEQPNMDDSIRCYIKGGLVAAVEGTTQEQYLSSILPSSQVAITKDYADALLSVVSGKTDCMLTNIGTAKSFQKAEESVEIVLQDICTYDTRFGIAKERSALRVEIDQFLTRSRADGTLDRLYDKWLTDLADADFPDYEYQEDAPVLKVGSSCTAVPFSFIANGRSVGLDIETLALFCMDAGYRLEVVEMPFGALISSIATGKVDVIANNLSATPERLEKIDFTLPYSHSCYALLYSRELIPATDDDSDEGLFASIYTSFVRNVLTEDRYKMIFDGLWVTIIISLLSIFFGTVVGAFICYLTMSDSKIYRRIGFAYVSIVRGTPVLVLLMINFYVVFAQSSLSPISVATISFAMNFGAYVSEMFRASIISIDDGQREAGLAMGFTPIQTFIYIIAPQAICRVLPVYKGEAISQVKMTSIVGYIAVQDITKVGDIIRSRTFDAFFPLLVSALLYFLIAYLFSKLLDLASKKFIHQKS